MIQRIQSIFLLLVAVCFFSLFGLNFVDIESADTANLTFLQDSEFNVHDHVIFLILAGIGGGLALLVIFLFNNRSLQMRLSYILIVFALMIPLLGVLLFQQEWNSIPANTLVDIEYGVIPPVLAIIFAALAIRFIKKDEKLVR